MARGCVNYFWFRSGGGWGRGTHTTTDGLALALTTAARTVAAVAVGEEQAGTGGEENCGSDEYAGCFVVVVTRKSQFKTYHPASWGNL